MALRSVSEISQASIAGGKLLYANTDLNPIPGLPRFKSLLLLANARRENFSFVCTIVPKYPRREGRLPRIRHYYEWPRVTVYETNKAKPNPNPSNDG